MRNYLLVALLISAFGSCALAAPKTNSTDQVFTGAQQPADVLGGQGDPFQLGMDFVADPQTGTGPTQGHFELKWEARDRWWRQIDMGGFRLTEIRVGSKLYTQRNSGFTPLAVREFL